jgi:hypothetical protein
MRREMGNSGRKRIETHLAWKHQEQHLLHAYASLANGARVESGLSKDRPPTATRRRWSRWHALPRAVTQWWNDGA